MKTIRELGAIKSKSLAVIVTLLLLITVMPLFGNIMTNETHIDHNKSDNNLYSETDIPIPNYSPRSSSRIIDVFNLQPDPANGNDTFVAFEGGTWVNKNFGSETYFGVGGDTKNYRGLIYFDLSVLPSPDVVIQKATLKLYFISKSGVDESDRPVGIYRVMESWAEGTGTIAEDKSDGATWNNKDGSSPWNTAGGFFNSVAENTTDVGAANSWYHFDVTNLVSNWRTGGHENFGLMVKYPDEVTHAGSFKTFYSSDSTSVDMRLKLSVEYQNSPPLVVATAPDMVTMEEDESEPDDLPMATVFNDQDGLDTLTFYIWTGTEWGTKYVSPIFNATLINKGSTTVPNWVIEFALQLNRYGSSTIKLNTTDQIRFVNTEIDILVSSMNDDPVLKTIGDQTLSEEVWCYLDVYATDIDEGNTLSFDANVTDYHSQDYLKDFLIQKDVNDPNHARISYFPHNEDVPEVYVNVTVEDGLGGVAYEHVKFTVTNDNDAPIILKVAGDQPAGKKSTIYATEGITRNFIVEAEDDDYIHGDEITFTANIPNSDNFTLDEDSGVVYFQPDNSHVPEFNVRITATDLDGSSDYVDIKFKVDNINNPPEIKELVSPKHNDKFTTDDTIDFVATYDDPDLHIPDSTEELNITWFSDIEGAIGYGGSLTDIPLSAGEHNITFKVKDKDPNTEAVKITFTITVTKAITLTEADCSRNYTDLKVDVVSYFYDVDTKNMEYEKGGEDNLDIFEISSKKIGDNLVIMLKVAGLIDSSNDYTVYLVKPIHDETTDFYNVKTTNVYDTLYKPNSTVMYGEIPDSYGTIFDDAIKYTINLGDLEAGDVEGFVEDLQSDFEIFVITRSRATEQYDTGLFSITTYDSGGYGSAEPGEAPTKKVDDDGSDAEGMNEYFGWIILIVIIVILVVLGIIFLLKSKKKAKVDIDYTGKDMKGQPGSGSVGTEEVPYLFQSQFEQQFGGARPPLPPGGGAGAPGYMQQQPPPLFFPPPPPPQQQQQPLQRPPYPPQQ